MALSDKRAVLSNLDRYAPLTIELGCGSRKRYPRSVGIDVDDHDEVDIVGDAAEALREFPENSAEFITSTHFLEHVSDAGLFLDEMARVVRVGGRIEIVVPHFAHPYFSSDPTHRQPFGLYTFSYLADDRIFRRGTPNYVRRPNLVLRDVRLLFKSTPPFVFRHGIKLLFGWVFNSCRYLQEFYEENLCYIFPCYEIRFVLEKIKP